MKVGDPKLAQQISLDNISPKAPAHVDQDSPEAIQEVAQNFESLFINELMKNMRKTLPADGILNKGFANNVFNSMLDQEYSKIASRSGQFGLADAIARQLGGDPAGIARREEVASEKTVSVNGEEIPAWALEEIQTDPWTTGKDQVNPADPKQVTPGLSTPAQSEFSPSAASISSAPVVLVAPAIQGASTQPTISLRGQRAYEQLTRPTAALPHAKR
jgi:flagellar protein FlgJ